MNLIAKHEVQVFEQLDLLEIELALVVDELLEPDLHFALICGFRLLYLHNVLGHPGISLLERGVFVL